MKLPFTFSLKFVFRVLLPGFVSALGCYPLLSSALNLLGVVASLEVLLTASTLLLGFGFVMLDMPLYMALEGRRFWPEWARVVGVNLEGRRLRRLKTAYRERQRQKVTQQGSVAAPPLPKQDGKPALVADPERTAMVAVESEDQTAAQVEPSAYELFSESTSYGGSYEPSEPIDTFLGPEVHRQARCDFCGRRCGVYSRNGFLPRR